MNEWCRCATPPRIAQGQNKPSQVAVLPSKHLEKTMYWLHPSYTHIWGPWCETKQSRLAPRAAARGHAQTSRGPKTKYQTRHQPYQYMKIHRLTGDVPRWYRTTTATQKRLVNHCSMPIVAKSQDEKIRHSDCLSIHLCHRQSDDIHPPLPRHDFALIDHSELSLVKLNHRLQWQSPTDAIDLLMHW